MQWEENVIQEIHAASDDRKQKWDKRNWHGVDLDGTLVEWHGPRDLTTFGKPIPAMVKRVKAWLKKGEQVKVFTARVDDLVQALGPQHYQKAWTEDQDVRDAIRKLTWRLFGVALPVTNQKDKWMVDLWDDRARGVVTNTGARLEAASSVRLLTRLSRS